MIRFTFSQVCRIQQGLDKESERMRQEQKRLTDRADGALKHAEEALAAAREQRERLGKELATAREYANRNQEALFSYENKIGLTLAELQKAEVRRDSADHALRHAEKALEEAKQLKLPTRSNPGYEMMAEGQKNAVSNANTAIRTAQARLHETETAMAEYEEKIKDIKPKMDICKSNLAEMCRISSEIGAEITSMDRYLRAVAEAMEKFKAQRDERCENLRHFAGAIEEPRRLATKAQRLLEGYREALRKIRLG